MTTAAATVADVVAVAAA